MELSKADPETQTNEEPPDQRDIYLLHDVFDYPFSDIAALLDKKPAPCRKAKLPAEKR